MSPRAARDRAEVRRTSIPGSCTSSICAGALFQRWLDPAINVWHQADPVTIGGRKFAFAEDEFAGAAGGPVCPSGGFHIYEITGEMERAPRGVRVVDLSGLATGEGLRQVGMYQTENADSWSAKTPHIEADGSFWLYGNAMARGLDVYRFDATKPESDSGGTWLGAQAAFSLPAAPRTGTSYVCLIQR